MDRLFQDCAYEGTEWAFRATSMINKQNARIADLERQLEEANAEIKKQRGIIFGERKFSEELCNDLRKQLAELREAVRNMFTMEAMPFPVVRYRDSEEKILKQMSAIREQTDERIAARTEVERLLEGK